MRKREPTVSSESEVRDGHTRRTVSMHECAAWRILAHKGMTCGHIALVTEFAESTVAKHVRNGASCGHATESAVGVAPTTSILGRQHTCSGDDPKLIAEVCEAIKSRLRRNYGDTVYFSSGVIADEVTIDALDNRVGAALTVIAMDSPMHGVTVERTNPDSGQMRFRATLTDG